MTNAIDAWRQAVRVAHTRAGAPSSRKVADLAGVTHNTIAAVLRGTVPTWATAVAILNALNVDPMELRPEWEAAHAMHVSVREVLNQARSQERVTETERVGGIAEDIHEIRLLLQGIHALLTDPPR